MGNEDSKHFLLHCPRYEEARRDLLGHLTNIPGLVLGELNTQSLYHLLLYGSPGLTLIANRMIMEATINFIKATKRFEISNLFVALIKLNVNKAAPFPPLC